MAQTKPGEALAAEARVMRAMAQELAELERMGLKALQARYLELFGEEARSKNLPYLRKKLAWRIQERVEGGLSPRAQALIAELAPAELPIKVPPAPKKRIEVGKGKLAVSEAPEPVPQPRDRRLPEAGPGLVREAGGLHHGGEVLARGFRYRGRSYGSLSAVAREITGTAWNGFLFFGLVARESSHGR